MSMAVIRSGISRAGAASLEQDAVNIPFAAYCSPDLFDLEVERLFRPGWLPIGRVDEVEKPGSYVSVDLFGEPLLMTRDQKGEIHVFSRLCPHRGMAVAEGSGEASLLRCPYHSWAFDLAGQCVRAPFMDETEGFDPAAQHLRPVRFEVWQGFVLVNLDGTAEALAPKLAALDAQLASAGIGDMVQVLREDFGEMPVDWKLILENSVECYHHCGTHAQTLQANFPAELSWAEAEMPHYAITYSVAKGDDAPKDGMTNALERIENSTGRIVTVYPLIHFVHRDDSVIALMVHPLGAGRSRVEARLMLPRRLVGGPRFDEVLAAHRARIKTIFSEDFEMCARMQRLTASRLMRVGRLSSRLEKPVWHFYRYLSGHLFA